MNVHNETEKALKWKIESRFHSHNSFVFFLFFFVCLAVWLTHCTSIRRTWNENHFIWHVFVYNSRFVHRAQHTKPSAERYMRCSVQWCAFYLIHVHRVFNTKMKPYALVSQTICFPRLCLSLCECVVVELGFDLFLLIVLVRDLYAWILRLDVLRATENGIIKWQDKKEKKNKRET